MQAEKLESWKISVSAKSKNFNFRLKAKKLSPTWKFHRFSLLLKFHRFLLQLSSHSAASFPKPKPRRQTFTSRFLGAVQKFRSRRAKKQTGSTEEASKFATPETKSSINTLKHLVFEEPVCTSSLVFGILAFLFQSIYEKDQRVIIVLGSVILLQFLTLLKKNITGKSKTVFAFAVIATAVCSFVFDSEQFLNYDQACIAEFVWKAGNCISWLPNLLSNV